MVSVIQGIGDLQGCGEGGRREVPNYGTSLLYSLVLRWYMVLNGCRIKGEWGDFLYWRHKNLYMCWVRVLGRNSKTKASYLTWLNLLLSHDRESSYQGASCGLYIVYC